ncbi:MAG TPA: helix-turn-helix domain-containing protein [Microlunatus sp.]|nr:helix-turn-helix domain-containing protein [Microlunatus sp.]
MGRWEPNAQLRLMQAALELFDERGFDQTTAGDIAERAGVTERTFFRHFPDKREVLFDSSRTMERTAHEATLAAPAELAPLDAALVGVTAGAAMLEDRREYAARRARIIASHPSLRERELLKLAALAATIAQALAERGVAEPVTTLAAESAVTAFRVGFERWTAAGPAGRLDDRITEAAAALRELAG